MLIKNKGTKEDCEKKGSDLEKNQFRYSDSEASAAEEESHERPATASKITKTSIFIFK